MASDSARSTAEYVTDTSGSSVQIVAPAVDLRRARQPPRATDLPPTSRRTRCQSCRSVPRLAAIRTALTLLRSRTRSPCRARTSALRTGSLLRTTKKPPRHEWRRRSPRRRWRTSAWHATVPRSAARVLRRHHPPLERCPLRLDFWDLYRRSPSPLSHLFYLKKFIPIVATLFTLLATYLDLPTS